MSGALLQYGLFVAILTTFVRPLGGYLQRIFTMRRTALDGVCGPVERLIYRVAGVDPSRDMSAAEYNACFILFGLAGTVLLYLILRLQRLGPWFFPAYDTTPLTPDLSLNTAISFSTTTTWQAYAGETTMGYASQMVGLCAQNFLAGAAGLAVGIAFIRGLARERSGGLGNFWVDLTRSLLWILAPGALVGAVILIWQGVPMNFDRYTVAASLEGQRQIIVQGPVAALEIIKNLGTAGGGFFNANGAHPFENPSALVNVLEMLAIVLVPAALTNTFGRMVGRPRQGWLLYGVMLGLFVAGLAVVHRSERQPGPRVTEAIGEAASARAGNMEGKDTRFGVGATTLTAVVTSNAATGSSNGVDDSFSPLGGMVLLVNMLLGEVVFGGLGTGLYSIVMAALVIVFVTGLMIGRTPEYLGKTIGPAETKMIMLYAIIGPFAILPLTAIAVSTGAGLAGLTTNTGPHGFSEILFAYASSFANNGQTFAGLNANTVFYNITTAVAMLAGRFGLAIPALALAGLFARQGRMPVTRGTLKTDSFGFGVALFTSLLILTALCHAPALVLGPVLEHLTLFGR